jgi:hypothetical protein
MVTENLWIAFKSIPTEGDCFASSDMHHCHLASNLQHKYLFFANEYIVYTQVSKIFVVCECGLGHYILSLQAKSKS